MCGATASGSIETVASVGTSARIPSGSGSEFAHEAEHLAGPHGESDARQPAEAEVVGADPSSVPGLSSLNPEWM